MKIYKKISTNALNEDVPYYNRNKSATTCTLQMGHW